MKKYAIKIVNRHDLAWNVVYLVKDDSKAEAKEKLQEKLTIALGDNFYISKAKLVDEEAEISSFSDIEKDFLKSDV